MHRRAKFIAVAQRQLRIAEGHIDHEYKPIVVQSRRPLLSWSEGPPQELPFL